jgi:hypothetical protein
VSLRHLAALLQITEEDMKDIVGRDGDAEQLKTHMSAPVIDKIHGRMDIRSHLYLSATLRRLLSVVVTSGSIWLRTYMSRMLVR